MKPITAALLTLSSIALCQFSIPAMAAGGETPVDRVYVTAPDAPRNQTQAAADAKSAGCMSCHNPIDQKSMHASPAVVLGCTDCHGGDATVMGPASAGSLGLERS